MSKHNVIDGLMPRTAQRQTASELHRAASAAPGVTGFARTAQQRKEAERAELERLMAEFRKRGGEVQVLGQTQLRQMRSRRKANADAAGIRATKGTVR